MTTEGPSPSAVEDLRSFADAVVAPLPVFRMPRTEALLHVLRTAQSLQTANEFGATIRGRVHGGYGGLRHAQDVLRWLVYKIFTRCPSGGRKTLTSSEDFRVASEAIGRFVVYSHLHDGIVSAEAGFFHCDIDPKERIIRFTPNPTIATQQIERQLREEFERTEEAIESLLRAGSLPQEETREFLRTARFDGDNLRLTYRFTGRVLKAFADSLELPDPLLPTALSVGPYTLKDFWTVWRYVAAYSAALHYLLFVACKEVEGAWTAHNSAALILARDHIVSQLRHHYTLRSPVALAVIQDLTYDPNVPWTDVMYQPLIPLNSREHRRRREHDGRGAGCAGARGRLPAFVRDLIDGTFEAIVDASIQQMEAYAELVAGVAQSVDRFLEENVSDDARAWLDRTLPGIHGAGEATAVLAVDAARRSLAKSRQQLLATMVLMGVNRALDCE